MIPVVTLMSHFPYGIWVEDLSLPGTGDRFLYSPVSLWVVFGGGTQLIITGQPQSPPTVHLFPPSPEEIKSKGKATLVCLVDGFSPPDITVNWQAGGTTISNGVETTKPTKHNNSYMVSSYLTVNPSDWERQDYTVKVTHKGSEYVKSVSHSQCP